MKTKMILFSSLVENIYSYNLDLLNIKISMGKSALHFLAIKALLISECIWKVATNATFYTGILKLNGSAQ